MAVRSIEGGEWTMVTAIGRKEWGSGKPCGVLPGWSCVDKCTGARVVKYISMMDTRDLDKNAKHIIHSCRTTAKKRRRE